MKRPLSPSLPLSLNPQEDEAQKEEVCTGFSAALIVSLCSAQWRICSRFFSEVTAAHRASVHASPRVLEHEGAWHGAPRSR